MKFLLFFLALTLVARAIDPPDVGIDQNIGTQLPLGRAFTDDADGQEKPLGDFFRSGRPAILMMGYFECPQLCTVVLNGVVESLTEIKPTVGRDMDVFFISIDPKETRALAADKKKTYARRYGKPESAPGWHFLTGPQESITAVAAAMGFRYKYDPEIKQFAHASGLAIVTPTGKISRYFYGIEFPPADLVKAISGAKEEKEGSPVKQLLLLCYHYNPLNGKYGKIVWRALQIGALLTLGTLVIFLLKSLRSEKRKKKEVGQ